MAAADRPAKQALSTAGRPKGSTGSRTKHPDERCMCAQRCNWSFYVHGERDLGPALCSVRSSAQCRATTGAIVDIAVCSAGHATTHNAVIDV